MKCWQFFLWHFKYCHISKVELETKLILAVYFVYSFSWTVVLEKLRRILAANHLVKTNFLTFCFYHTNLTEDLNAPRCVLSGSLLISTPDLQKLCKYSSLDVHISTYNIGHPVLLPVVLFSLLWQLLCTKNNCLHAQTIQSIPL